MKPLQDYLLIRPVEKQEKTNTGIYIPDDSAEKLRPREGTIIAIGPNVKYPFTEGQRVVFKAWGGNEIKNINKINSSMLLVLEEDVLAIQDDTVED